MREESGQWIILDVDWILGPSEKKPKLFNVGFSSARGGGGIDNPPKKGRAIAPTQQ